MLKQSIIILLSLSIIMQNTCLMGVAGQSILFRASNKVCPMHCHSGCRAQSPSDNGGVKTYKKDIEQNSTHAICYFQFRAEDIVAASELPITHGLYFFGTKDQFKSPFLDPPSKPPNFGFSV